MTVQELATKYGVARSTILYHTDSAYRNKQELRRRKRTDAGYICEICNLPTRRHEKCKLCTILLHDYSPDFLDKDGKQYTERVDDICIDCFQRLSELQPYIKKRRLREYYVKA